MKPELAVASAHHTRRGFRNNYAGPVQKGLTEFLKWQWQRHSRGLPRAPTSATPAVAPDLDFLARNGSAGMAMEPSATWIGHSSVLVQASGLNVLTDPIFSQRASPLRFAGPKRAQPPAIALPQLPGIDVVLISHNHYDHLDRDSVLALARRHHAAQFLVPLGLARWFQRLGIERVTELDWWQSHTVGAVEFTLTPTQHWSGRGAFDRSHTLWGAWAALAPEFHWYFGGDTAYSPDFIDTRDFFAGRQSQALGGGFDLALLAIGAYAPRWFMRDQHVEPLESVRIHQDLGAKESLAIHWGTFELTDESLDHPPSDLARALEQAGIAADLFCCSALGATSRYARRVTQHD